MAIKTRRSALAALRKLGYKKSFMQMTRNATTYTKGGGPGGRLIISLSNHGDFVILDHLKRPNNWSFLSMALATGNLRAGATKRLNEILLNLQQAGVIQPSDELTMFDLAVAMARAANLEEN